MWRFCYMSNNENIIEIEYGKGHVGVVGRKV